MSSNGRKPGIPPSIRIARRAQYENSRVYKSPKVKALLKIGKILSLNDIEILHEKLLSGEIKL